jgi:hypothetical protein
VSARDADEAIAIAGKHGWRIFPVGLVRQASGKITKQPLIEKWPNRCSVDPRVIRQWWQHWPDAVPSVVTGPRNGLVVLDIDIGVDDKGRPYSGFDTLEEQLGWWALPEVPMVHTRRGGLHLYFTCERAPDEEVLDAHSPRKAGSIRNGASLLGPHLDVRGWNGQAVLPASNSGYWWDPHYNFDTCEPMRAPDWFDYRPPNLRPAPARQSSGEPRRQFDPQAVLDMSCRRILHAPQGPPRYLPARDIPHRSAGRHRADRRADRAPRAVGGDRTARVNRRRKQRPGQTLFRHGMG